MEFPATITPDLDTRVGRMTAAGDLRATVTSKNTGEHITIRFKAFKDTREQEGKNWTRVPLEDATHVFVEVPTPDSDGWADKVGTFYPKSGKWFSDDRADGARVFAAAMVARWINGEQFESRIQEEERCGKCARTLTDPVSIERGIGPECYGKDTGSQHQVKSDAQKVAEERAIDPEPHTVVEAIESNEARMQQMEMNGDREQTVREETVKFIVKSLLETPELTTGDLEGIIATARTVLNERMDGTDDRDALRR